MTVSSLKRPRVDDLLLRDRSHSLSTIHPAKKLFTGNDGVSKAAKLRKSFFSAAAPQGTKTMATTTKPPFTDRTNLEVNLESRLHGFSTHGLLSVLGASNAVTQKLIATKLCSAETDAEGEAETVVGVGAGKGGNTGEISSQTLANDLAAARLQVVDTIRKVSFLTKEQKLRLMKLVNERRSDGLYGVELKQYGEICAFLNAEQGKYLERLRERQRV